MFSHSAGVFLLSNRVAVGVGSGKYVHFMTLRKMMSWSTPAEEELLSGQAKRAEPRVGTAGERGAGMNTVDS
jgi:hypothetical protein